MPLRWTDNGAVIGRENKETGVEEFLGIPFASVKRFQRAEKYEEWEEPLVCNYSSYSYPQDTSLISFDLIPKIQNFEDLNFSSESELRLDVYVPPTAREEDKLPVMVYIHGGSLLNGGPAEYPGNTNLPKIGNVVLVVIQYRLGMMGFYSYKDGEKIVGNFGLYDQIAALEWVQLNIEHFNGDPKNVTIFGESAGAFSCDALIRSKFQQKGLFHRAIVQSGSLLSTWCPQTPASRQKAVDCYCAALSVSSEAELKNALLKMTTQELIEFEKKHMGGARGGERFLIVADDEIVNKDFYNFKNEMKMPLYYGRQLSEGEYLLTRGFPGFAQGEMSAEICREIMKRQIENWEIECTEVLLDEILELYKELDEDGKINYAKTFGRWYGDWLIGSGVFMMAQNVNSFTYQFDVIPIWFHSEEHRGNCQIKPKWCEGDHADDLPYVFGWVLGDKPGQRIKPTELDKKLSKKVIHDWSAFASGKEPVCNKFTKSFDDVAIYTNQPRMRKIDNEKYEKKTALFRKVFEQRCAKFQNYDY